MASEIAKNVEAALPPEGDCEATRCLVHPVSWHFGHETGRGSEAMFSLPSRRVSRFIAHSIIPGSTL